MAASPLDLLESANSYVFVIDTPGLDPDDVRVQVKSGNLLLISNEERRVEVDGAKDLCMERRRMGKFALPEKANTGKITTVSRDGVLTVTVEKLPPPPPQPKAIEEQLRIHGDERKLHIGAAVDRLSMLPDELLLCILSLLSFKEATATSILCRRWRHLHTFTSKLDFDGIKISRKSFYMEPKDFEVLRQKFHSWVDGVVRLNQSSRLEKFSVRFYLRGGFGADDIDEWVRFALSKKVESLELFSPWDWLAAEEKYWTLNFHKWDYDFNFMKKLVTHGVDVSGEAVEMLLRKCPLLEQLSVADSEQLLSLEIIKPFPAFRSLEILECWNLSSVVVDDSNIVSFKYSGDMVDKVVLVNVPLLTELWISGGCTKSVQDMFQMFSSVLPQIHTFKICITWFWELRDFCLSFCTFMEMSNLKQLVVDIDDIYVKHDLLPLADLVRAFRGLQRFVIEEPYENNHADIVVEVEPIEIAGSVDRNMFVGNTELKEVEFVGYRGVSTHFGLIKHLVENVAALETIVVDPWGFKKPYYAATFDQIPRRKYDHKIFARANALKRLVPSGINVKIVGLEH